MSLSFPPPPDIGYVIVSTDGDALRAALQSVNGHERVAGFTGSLANVATRVAAETMGREMFRVDEIELLSPDQVMMADK